MIQKFQIFHFITQCRRKKCSNTSQFHKRSSLYLSKIIRPPSRLPWDQQTLRGWICETVFSVISSSLYLHTNMVFLTFYIAICEFHQAFVRYFADLMKQIQNVNGNGRVKLMLCNVIRCHISIKRYFTNGMNLPLAATYQCAEEYFSFRRRFSYQ